MKKWFWVVIIICTAGACLDEPDCVEMTNAYVGISFKKMFDGKADTVVFISVQSLATDSIFYPFTRITSPIALPLNQFTNQTEYLFEEVFGENFLVMTYESTPQFVSEDCGTRYVVSGLEFASHDFDSVNIITSVLTTTPHTNIEVYRCPRTNMAKVAFRQLVGEVEKADTVYLSSLSADYPAVFFIPDDTLSYVNLPLNPGNTSTTFSFGFKDGSNRTITFDYTSTPWDDFNSACGTLSLLSDLKSPIHNFDSVRISKDSIQDPPITNVAIFK